jgi:hypothetical protein
MGAADALPLASRASTMAAGHVGGSPRLVGEDKAIRIEITLAV